MPNQSDIPTNDFVAHRFHIQQSDTRPNILLLMTDQQRFDTIHSAGYDFMNAPNLDRLVEEGCLYRYGYSPNPICLAARHNLITGLTGFCCKKMIAELFCGISRQKSFERSTKRWQIHSSGDIMKATLLCCACVGTCVMCIVRCHQHSKKFISHRPPQLVPKS